MYMPVHDTIILAFTQFLSKQILLYVSLRLLLNLSFDPVLRVEMVKAGLLPKLVALLSKKMFFSPLIKK